MYPHLEEVVGGEGASRAFAEQRVTGRRVSVHRRQHEAAVERPGAARAVRGGVEGHVQAFLRVREEQTVGRRLAAGSTVVEEHETKYSVCYVLELGAALHGTSIVELYAQTTHTLLHAHTQVAPFIKSLNRPLLTRGASCSSSCGEARTSTVDQADDEEDAPPVPACAPRFQRGSALASAWVATSTRRLASRRSQARSPLSQTGRRELSAAQKTRTATGVSQRCCWPLRPVRPSSALSSLADGAKVMLAGTAWALGPRPITVTTTGAVGSADSRTVYSAGASASPKLLKVAFRGAAAVDGLANTTTAAAAVGTGDGRGEVGAGLGARVGASEGRGERGVGAEVDDGAGDGAGLGVREGCRVGVEDGTGDGAGEGLKVGRGVGAGEGAGVGRKLGT